jgi:hypothetical protein
MSWCCQRRRTWWCVTQSTKRPSAQYLSADSTDPTVRSCEAPCGAGPASPTPRASPVRSGRSHQSNSGEVKFFQGDAHSAAFGTTSTGRRGLSRRPCAHNCMQPIVGWLTYQHHATKISHKKIIPRHAVGSAIHRSVSASLRCHFRRLPRLTFCASSLVTDTGATVAALARSVGTPRRCVYETFSLQRGTASRDRASCAAHCS